jgi:hypothetical protein
MLAGAHSGVVHQQGDPGVVAKDLLQFGQVVGIEACTELRSESYHRITAQNGGNDQHSRVCEGLSIPKSGVVPTLSRELT